MSAIKRYKASDITDEEMLRAVWRLSGFGAMWVMDWDVADTFSEFPAKVVHAKLTRLANRKLLGGCACGCRGDWHLRRRGAELIGVELRPDHASYGDDDQEAA